MKERTCSFTGHRKVMKDKLESVKNQISIEVGKAIDEGCDWFISGMADGLDMVFAEIVIAYKTLHKIKLEAAIPYRDRILNRDVKRILNECDRIVVLSEEYRKDVYEKRNRYMVNQSGRVIAAYDGRGKGGTYNTIKYIHSLETPPILRAIDI